MKETIISTTPLLPTLSPARAGILQRKCACGQHTGGGECEECKKKNEGSAAGYGLLQRKASSAQASPAVPSIVHEVLRSPGQPLDAATREFFGPRFGYDFSRVRIHTDARAAESARAIDAVAYTFGREIVFAADHYVPASRSGQALLAHELTHVVQQRGSHALSPSEISHPYHGTEVEARAAEVSLGLRAPLASLSTATIHRQPADQNRPPAKGSAAGQQPQKPSAGATLCTQFSSESMLQKNPKFCMDTSTSGSLHAGFRCYREIPTGSGCPPGQHICFDLNTGKCDSGQSHIDDTAPTLSRDKGGMCDVSYLGLCSIDHLFTDVIPDLLKESGQTMGQGMADCHSTCEALPWYLKGACAAGCNPMSR